MRFVKPLDLGLLLEALAQAPLLVTIEDGALEGGFGSAVLEALADRRPRLLRLGIPDQFIEHGAPAKLYDAVGLSADRLVERIAAWFRQQPESAK
jgi:1-deoxy-D-xylulose-5-phosphate synthase